MKIYVIRHQKRPPHVNFTTPLSSLGKELSEKETKQKLNELGITQIYSSPFLRTLQIVDPYVKSTSGLKINVEFGLYERIVKNLFNKKNYKYKIPDEWLKKYKINSNYQSIIKLNDIKYDENPKDIEKRLQIFLETLYQKYSDTNETILLVSHMSPIYYLLKLCGHNIPIENIKTGKIWRIV